MEIKSIGYSSPVSKYVTSTYSIYDLELLTEVRQRMILHWNYRNLTTIPLEVIDHGNQVKEIYLKRNSITKLPPEVGTLVNLTNLYLGGNQLTSLPPEIGQLRNLKVLDLSQNNLTILPKELNQLQSLQQLILTQNQLTQLPELNKLKYLFFLELSSNRLRSLREGIINGLESLEDLVIDQNPLLQSLPRSITQLPSLRYLSVCQGNLTFLPIPCSSQFLQFRFDGNSRLNYLPYPLIQSHGWPIECYGCATQPAETIEESNHKVLTDNNGLTETIFWSSLTSSSIPKIHFIFKDQPHTLHFDEHLCKIIQPMTTKGPQVSAPCTLVELCLRIIYKMVEYIGGVVLTNSTVKSTLHKRRRKWINSLKQGIIPFSLARLLEIGPVTLCSNCNQPIFSTLCPFVFILPDNEQSNLLFHPQPNEDHYGNGDERDENRRIRRLDHHRTSCSIRFCVIYYCGTSCYWKDRQLQGISSRYLQREIIWYKN